MERILYSQNESIINDDYFVIDGVIEVDNVSTSSLQAFEKIRATENWKEIYSEEDLVVKKKGKFLSIKSHYTNKDDSGRFLFYIYFIESNDLKDMLSFLKKDSEIIAKELAFESERLILDINKSRSRFRKIIGGL